MPTTERRSSANEHPLTMVVKVSTRSQIIAWLARWTHTVNRPLCTDNRARIKPSPCSTQRVKWCRIMGYVLPPREDGPEAGSSRTSFSTNAWHVFFFFLFLDALWSPTYSSYVSDARSLWSRSLQPTSRSGTTDGDESTWHTCTAPPFEPVSLDFRDDSAKDSLSACFRMR